MERLSSNPFPKIRRKLAAKRMTAKEAEDAFDVCVDALTGQFAEEAELKSVLPVMEQLASCVSPQNAAYLYDQSILDFLRGDFTGYLEKTEQFCQRWNQRKRLDWYLADRLFVRVIKYLPTQGECELEQVCSLWRALQGFAEVYFPRSAFASYCKYLGSQGSLRRRMRLLQDVLEEDSSWMPAWRDEGDLYSENSEWGQAFRAYERALTDSRMESAELLFQASYAAGEAKEWGKAASFGKACIERDPEYPCAQGNTAEYLMRERKYAEAEPYLRYAIERSSYGDERRDSCRNLLAVLEKLGRTEELYELARRYPEYFRTKIYREKIAKVGQSDGLPDVEELQALLQKKTVNEYAGILETAPGSSGVRLYEHQKKAVRNLDEWKRKSDCGAGLLVLPTGGGKTLTATYWLMKSVLDQGGRVLWLAHRHELLNQALRSFKRVCYQDLSPHRQEYRYRIVSGQHDKAVHIRAEDDLLIASKSSLAYNLSHIERWIAGNRDNLCLVIDEAHHAPAREYRKLIQAIQKRGGNFRMLGLTATPFRTAEKEQGLLAKLFPDDILYKIDLRTLIEYGILAEPIFHSVKTQIKMSDWFHAQDADELLERLVQEKGLDFGRGDELSEEAARLIADHGERNRLIVDTYVDNRELYGKTLIFAINPDMAVTINKLLLERGVRSEYVISCVKDPDTGINRSPEENAANLQRFRDGELDVLVNVNILTEGTDLPQVQTVFLTRPTKSAILMTQMIGRALRGEKAGGAAKAYIVSFLDDWQEYIAWVNPEKLYIDTNADFSEHTPESRKYLTRLVSIAKLEEFAKLVDENVDSSAIEKFPFLERIPVGLYQFTYLPEDAEESRNGSVLVYDCMQEAYRELLDWMETADLSDLDAAAEHVDQTLFGEKERQLGYRMQDVYDILAYYRQTGVKPQWIRLEERAEYDVASVARRMIDQNVGYGEVGAYLEDEWNRSGEKWSAFFGYENFKAFRLAVLRESDRLMYPEPEDAEPKPLPITRQEEIQIQELPLQEIRRRYPEIGERLREAVFSKFRDADGYYYSAESGYRSKNRLDFQIDHKKPMSRGGLTTLDNLQLLTRQENGLKGDGL